MPVRAGRAEEWRGEVTTEMKDDDALHFLAGFGDLSADPRLACLAVCVVNQQAAGFRNAIDIREATCPDCKASGFNTGWGFWRFSCGAEILIGGEFGEPCGAREDSRDV